MALAKASSPPNDTNNCISNEGTSPPKELHIAPMLAVSTAEFRYFMRLLTKHTILWTEMIVDETIFHNPNINKLELCPLEHPVICQLGGNRPDWTANPAAPRIAQAGFDEINLNAECPSSRVAGQKEFGAALMKNIDLCVEMLNAMQSSTAAYANSCDAPNNTKTIPISIKTRIGVDDCEGWDEFLLPYIQALYDRAGCRRFYIHARKVYTKGLNPEQNRTVPPLDYSLVYRLCRTFPDADFWINGGIRTLQQAKDLCYGTYQDAPAKCATRTSCQESTGSCVTAPPAFPAPNNLRGCLMGRTAMEDPSVFALADTAFWGSKANPTRSRRHALEMYCRYLEQRFPRRCCDSNPVVTKEHPAPKIVHERDACPLCGDEIDERTGTISGGTAKMTSRVIDCSLKPVLGLFHGLRGAKTWKRACNEVSRDLKRKNCGPAYLLRRAMRAVPVELLDQEWGAASSQ